MDPTDQPASLYAATKKAGEEIAHTYNHIYGLSITNLHSSLYMGHGIDWTWLTFPSLGTS
jgi:nucleoside-diphosphate-sugar epimerase